MSFFRFLKDKFAKDFEKTVDVRGMITADFGMKSLEKKFRPVAEKTPSLNVMKIFRTAGVDQTCKVDWLDSGGQTRFDAEVQVIPNELLLDFGFADGIYDPFTIQWGEIINQGGPTRRWMICEGCGCQTHNVYIHIGGWKCRRCHGVVYASQYMTKFDKKSLERKELLAIISNGRPQYMRTAKWIQVLDRIEQLNAELKDMPPVPTHREFSRNFLTGVYSLVA